MVLKIRMWMSLSGVTIPISEVCHLVKSLSQQLLKKDEMWLPAEPWAPSVQPRGCDAVAQPWGRGGSSRGRREMNDTAVSGRRMAATRSHRGAW